MVQKHTSSSTKSTCYSGCQKITVNLGVLSRIKLTHCNWKSNGINISFGRRLHIDTLVLWVKCELALLEGGTVALWVALSPVASKRHLETVIMRYEGRAALKKRRPGQPWLSKIVSFAVLLFQLLKECGCWVNTAEWSFLDRSGRQSLEVHIANSDVGKAEFSLLLRLCTF